MEIAYSIFLRTAVGVRKTKEVLEALIKSPFQQIENHEIFRGSFLGLNLLVEYMDEDLNQKIVQFDGEFIPLSTYDLEIKFWYDEHFFIRDYGEEWTQMVATVLSDSLCLRLSCETLAVRDLDAAFARYMPFEERFTDR